ncbi:hypothetical protein [Prauserella alba]|nr:hypothetical protein [Prauserella alba]
MAFTAVLTVIQIARLALLFTTPVRRLAESKSPHSAQTGIAPH